ncbi:MAG TPA: efflux RND transporter periplasmic adaptor subunit [Verrucomicrobiae bacterium]|nr:efflux RND transporter periplasmic adaptor subunit [Verrucomicrobiae bacterium]
MSENSNLGGTGEAGPSGGQRIISSATAEKKSHWWIWVVGALVVLALVIYVRQRAASNQEKVKAAPPAKGVPILAAEAKKGDIGVYVEALGTVTPVYTVTVTSRVQGEIVKIYYKEGQMVSKGDPLIDIDPRPYEAALTQAQGQLAHDQAVLSEAQIDYDRYKAAYARNAIAQQQVADQEQAVLQDEGTVKNDQGNLDNAKVNLVYTHITSPIDGRVGLRLVDLGNIVQANSTTPLLVITQLQPITVIFSVAEDYLPEIQKEIRAGERMRVDALDRQQETELATGYLLTLDNEVDPTTGTVKLKAQFENRDNVLFPNQFVNARLLVKTIQNATLVPTQAVQQSAQGPFVYVIKEGGIASMQTIKQGTTDGDVTSVEGVEPGATVATSGFDKLQDGAKVAIRSGKGTGQGGNQGQGATSGEAPHTAPTPSANTNSRKATPPAQGNSGKSSSR